jgi:hypothetical protein
VLTYKKRERHYAAPVFCEMLSCSIVPARGS